MSQESSKRRMAENEAVFRKLNEQVEAGLGEIRQIATEERMTDLADPPQVALHFYCECSDENCVKRIPIDLDTYKRIHKQRDCFVIIPGHEVVSIEEIVESKPQYAVVRKRIGAPENPDHLHRTEVDNS